MTFKDFYKIRGLKIVLIMHNEQVLDGGERKSVSLREKSVEELGNIMLDLRAWSLWSCLLY